MGTPSTPFRASKLEDWEVEAARTLRTLFKQHATLSQKAFGVRYDIGSPGMVSQYLRGYRPLGLEAALKFARGLGIDVGDISPHYKAKLAAQGDDIATALAARLSRADEATRKLIEIALYENDETAVQQLTPSLVSLVRAMKDMIREQGRRETP